MSVADHPGADHSSHPGTEELADHLVGELPTDRVRALESHLSDCPSCRARLSRARALPALLRGAPAPPMPDDVARRLHAVVADEAARAVGHPPTAPPPVPLHAGAGRRPRARLLLAAAAVVLVGAAGTTAVHWPGLGGAGRTGTASESSGSSGSAQLASKPAAAAQITASGRNYGPDSVVPAARALVEGSPPASAGPPATSQPMAARPQPRAASGPAAVRSFADVPGCLTALGLAGRAGVAVDVARWQGAPAMLVVAPDGSARLSLWVVEPRCTTGSPATLVHRTIPR